MKGVQMLTPSLGFKVINTRGFSNTTNVRFAQLVDGIDNQTPHIGAPIANVLCPSDLDIEKVEIIQGVASALYGMNATNGLANFSTKNPFYSEGITFRQQFGVNHVNNTNNISPKIYNESNLRWAKVLNPKWAFKINLGLTEGYDWIADNRTDLNPLANQTTGLLGSDNPAFDAVNGYGNESSNRKTLVLGGKNYVVARTGYRELDVVDYSLQNWKGDAALFYRPNEKTTISYTYRTAFLNSVYQRSNRFRLDDYFLQQNILQFKNPFLQIKAYVNAENTGNSYNLRSMAENIDRNFKTDDIWFADYTKSFNNALKLNPNVAQAHQTARQMADNGRPQPNTPLFQRKIDTLSQINNWDIGAALKVRAQLVHTEGVLDVGKMLDSKVNLQVGADFRQYMIVPDGNYFINPKDSIHNLTYSKYGFFIHASQDFLNHKLRISVALRADKNEYFDLKWNPRLTAVYALTENDFLRFSYQKGYRFPSIFEGFSNINSGGVKRIGGLKVMSNGIFENSWLKSSIDAFQATVLKDVNTVGLTQAAAIEKNKTLLQRNTYTYLQPEQMHAFEGGYRGVIGSKLFFDIDGYYNSYADFIAQVEASVPNTTDEIQIPTFLYTKAKQNRYRLWTNSKTTVYNYGVGLDIRYVLSDQYSIAANASYAALKKTDQNDGLEDGFNTPKWMGNLSFNGTKVYEDLNFNVTLKYQSAYYWQSFLVNGDVPSVFKVDCHLSYLLKQAKCYIKIGATNVLNQYYYGYLGGSQIGGYYYTTLTYGF
jgi:iron complex outermembrane receptor protein